ncbi:MAG TPA: ATP-dependent DNA helicase, partial [Chthonomonadaceae bacterium]|nr:ATP-dependent DNA helicase [Chthonomonadaceae bacterium]
RKGSVSLISATLANSGGFSYQRSRLGVPEEAVECLVGSPFDFKRQAMLYVPGALPAPPARFTEAYVDRMVVEIEKVLALTEGRAFLLFTSRAVLNAVYERLNGKLPFPLFKQGDLPPGKLVEAFKASGNGCLFGAQTFWEGVDIQGEALSCVLIDKLPFAVPDSPITKARTKAIEEAGGNWFRDYSIPQAQIRLKQGFGRLIRTRSDRGIVCILDSRLINKDYGPEFVRYLPQASRASKWPRVEKFWSGELVPSESEPPITPSATDDATKE